MYRCLRLIAHLTLLMALLAGMTGCIGLTSSKATDPPPTPAISVSISASPTSVQVATGAQSSATVTNDPAGKGVTWTVSGAGCSGNACGTVSPASTASGVNTTYTAPASVPSPATVTLTATSVADPTKSASATITITALPPPVSVQLSTASASVQTSLTAQFSATVQNDSQNKGVTWRITGTGCSGAACGTVSPASTASGVNTTYTAPASVPSPATVTLTATSVADPTKSASATITITALPPPVSVQLSTASASVQTSLTAQFSATVQNDSQNKGVTWRITGAGCSGAACGTVSPASTASGVNTTYTAPASVPSPATVTLTATSVADPTKSASATITITALPPPVSVQLSTASASVQTSLTAQFSATVQNDSQNKGVTWRITGTGCSGAACGTVSPASTASGVNTTYTAPASVPSPATVTLTATSVADPTKSASATITITASPPPISVQLSATSVTLLVSTTSLFTATVQNDSQNKGVTWSISGAGCSGAACGNVLPTSTASGVATTYTAPVSVPNPATVTLTATSVADPTQFASATITVAAASGLTLVVDTGASFQTWGAWEASQTGLRFTATCGFQAGCSIPVPDSVLNAILDDLVNDFGLTRLRLGPAPAQAPKTVVPGSPYIQTVNGTQFDFSKTWLNPDGAVQDGVEACTKIIVPMKQRAEANGETFSIIVASGWHYNQLDSAMLTASGYADFAQAYVQWFHAACGIYPQFWTLANEPDGSSWNLTTGVSQMSATASRFTAQSFPTKLALLEFQNAANTNNSLPTYPANPTILAGTGLLTYHGYDPGYDGTAPPNLAARNTLRNTGAANGIPTGMTERCCLANNNGGYLYGIEQFRDIYWNMTEANASVWEPEAMMFPCGPANLNCSISGGGDMINLNTDLSGYHKFAPYYAVRQLSHYIRPGHTRIGVTCSGCTNLSVGQNMKPVAFKSAAGKATVVVINDQNSIQTITILGLPAGTYNITGVDPAHATAPVTYSTQTIGAGGSIVFSFPAQAIITFTQQ